MHNTFQIIVSGLIINSVGKFLLAKRSETEETFPGYRAIPGGKVEVSDDKVIHNVLEFNLRRELSEELGVLIDNISYINSHFNYNNGQFKIYICFLVKHIEGAPQALEDTSEISYFSIDEIENLLLAPQVKEIIQLTLNIA